MRSLRNLLAVITTIAALTVLSASAQTRADSPGKSVDQQVRSKILGLPYYEVFDYISYSVEGRTVTLSGKVRNATNRDAAESAVKKIGGVESVVNNIEVLPVGSFDESIRRSLYRTLSNSGSLSRYLSEVNPDVRLVVEGGHVTLEGEVYSSGDRDAMNILASGVQGVFSVQNNLTIGSGKKS